MLHIPSAISHLLTLSSLTSMLTNLAYSPFKESWKLEFVYLGYLAISKLYFPFVYGLFILHKPSESILLPGRVLWCHMTE